jgi:tRNA U34 2-thiouridine synthase MnmA/TrmU
LALLSGGLDSTLAVKLMVDQGVEVEAVNFVSPFCLCKKGGCGASTVAKNLNVPLKIISVGEDYLRLVRKPRFGYGKNMNPCIDCRIHMLKKAKKYADETGAMFVLTGEVLGQRPMSQHTQALRLIEKEAGLEGKILRPLSAKSLAATEAEKRGLVNRGALLGIQGRSRREQIRLASELNVTGYSCPGGGCLLTCKEFACKLKDLFEHRKTVSMKDMQLLKIGRHFRLGKNKIIVGRNKAENGLLLLRRMENDYCFEAQDTGSPIALLQGPKTKAAFETAGKLTAFYSDIKKGKALVKFGKGTFTKSLTTTVPEKKEVEQLSVR